MTTLTIRGRLARLAAAGLGAVALLAELPATAAPAHPAPATSDALVIDHVTVVTMVQNAKPVADATVVIQGGRIVSISHGAAGLPKGAPHIDGHGKWLMPALADMHVHIENHRLMSGVLNDPAIGAGTIRTDDLMTPYVANGVLQIMDMSADPEGIAQRDAIDAGDVLGPHIALAAMIDGSPPFQSPVMTQVAATPEDGRQIVRSLKWSGYDFVKVYGNLAPETFDAILDEAAKAHMKVLGHIPGMGKIPTERFFRPGYAMVAHAEEFSREGMKDEDIPRYVEMAKRNGTWLTATLALDDNILAQTRDPDYLKRLPGLAYVHPVTRPLWFDMNRYFSRRSPERIAHLEQQVRFTRMLTKAFAEAGIPVLAGTDTLVPGMASGFALHDELEALARAGLSNEQVLAGATRLPAEWLGVSDDRGVIAPGKRADLILLDADPLADVANTRRIAAVIVGGRYLPRAELARRMAALARRYAAMPTFKALAPAKGGAGGQQLDD